GVGPVGDPVLWRLEWRTDPVTAAALVSPEGGVLRLRVDLVPFHLPPLPLRPADGDRVESLASAVIGEHNSNWSCLSHSGHNDSLARRRCRTQRAKPVHGSVGRSSPTWQTPWR